MKPPVQSDDFEFVLGVTNYLHISCKKCDGEAAVEYKGLDPIMPEIELECAQCGVSATVKIFNPGAWKGFHPAPFVPSPEDSA